MGLSRSRDVYIIIVVVYSIILYYDNSSTYIVFVYSMYTGNEYMNICNVYIYIYIYMYTSYTHVLYMYIYIYIYTYIVVYPTGTFPVAEWAEIVPSVGPGA